MYTSFDQETIDAAFGVMGAQVFDSESTGPTLLTAASKIPGAVNLGHESCLQRCGLKDSFNINGKISNPDLMNMAFAGYLKSQNFDYNGYNASNFQQYN